MYHNHDRLPKDLGHRKKHDYLKKKFLDAPSKNFQFLNLEITKTNCLLLNLGSILMILFNCISLILKFFFNI